MNESHQIVHDVFLVDLPLMLGLEVFDEGERRLAFLPNQHVRSIVQLSLKEETHPIHARIQEIMRYGLPYFLWIKLGVSDRIEPVIGGGGGGGGVLSQPHSPGMQQDSELLLNAILAYCFFMSSFMMIFLPLMTCLLGKLFKL